MCGICGLISTQFVPEAAQLLVRMNNSLRHRGPDDAGYWLFEQSGHHHFAAPDSHPDILQQFPQLNLMQGAVAAFAHRRLAIIDLSSASHQPLVSSDARYLLSYNGELYNYIELRATLTALGHVFTTNGDAEVLLAAWQQWQAAALERFEGMWAFALYDTQEDKMWLVRDPSGVKPLFYSKTGEVLLFASEPKALLASGKVKTTINAAACYSFLVHAALDEAAGHLLEEIQELQPGHLMCFERSNGQISLKNYHKDRFYQELSEKGIPEALTDEIYAKLQHAVDLRLRSDVKVGASLSGGLDSSTLAALAAKAPGFPVFTAVYEGFPENEAHYAQALAVKLQASWHVVEVKPALIVNRLEEMVRIQDGPILALSTFAQLLINEKAKAEGVTILLDGQGGDELFSGYDRYWLSYYRQAWEKWDLTALKEAIQLPAQRNYLAKAFIYGRMPALFSHHFMVPLLKKLLKRNKFELHYLREAYKNEHWPVSLAFLQQLPKSGVNEQQIQEMYGYDLKNLLRWGDRNSMSVAIENRAPFADDPHLAKLLLRLPASLKMSEGKSKLLLRTVMHKRLPAIIVNRTDKQGFTTPMQAWMRDLWPHWRVYLSYLPDSIDIKAVEKDSLQLLNTATGAAFLLRLVSLGAWLKNLQNTTKSA